MAAKKATGTAASSRTVVEIPKDHDWMAADEQAADAAALASPRSDGSESLGVLSGDLGTASGLGRASGGLGGALHVESS
jgi:hypothetical protein